MINREIFHNKISVLAEETYRSLFHNELVASQHSDEYENSDNVYTLSVAVIRQPKVRCIKCIYDEGDTCYHLAEEYSHDKKIVCDKYKEGE